MKGGRRGEDKGDASYDLGGFLVSPASVSGRSIAGGLEQYHGQAGVLLTGLSAPRDRGLRALAETLTEETRSGAPEPAGLASLQQMGGGGRV